MTRSRIRALRQELGLSQTQLAEALYVSQQLVNHWESNSSGPSGSHLLVLQRLEQMVAESKSKKRALDALMAAQEANRKRLMVNGFVAFGLGILFSVLFENFEKEQRPGNSRRQTRRR